MATFPSKVNYATGDILTATNMNEIGQAINLLDGAQYAAGINKVINSNMSVWQRGTSFTVGAASLYTADRWQANRGSLTTGLTVTRQVTNDTTNLPNIQYCARIQRDSGNTSTATNSFWQNFESVNSIPFAGKTVTFSFYARAGSNYSATSNILNVNLYSGTGTDQNVNTTGFTGAVQVINSNATLTTTWQRFTYTGTVATNATQLGILIVAYPTGTAGANDYFEITGVQVEAANTASPYTPNGASYQAELAACQRYYAKSYNQATAPGSLVNEGYIVYSAYMNVTAVANFRQTTRFPITMRTAPSVTIYAASTTSAASGNWRNNGTSANVAAVAYYISDGGFSSYNNVSTGINQTNELSYHYEASAEL
jgi:hypothetical protein